MDTMIPQSVPPKIVSSMQRVTTGSQDLPLPFVFPTAGTRAESQKKSLTMSSRQMQSNNEFSGTHCINSTTFILDTIHYEKKT